MTDSDHRIKKNFVFSDDSSDTQKDKCEKLREQFQWDEDSEEETDVELLFSMEDVKDCCVNIIDHTMKHISAETLSDVTMGKLYFEIPFASSFHSLLESRFDNSWSLASRLEVIDAIRFELSRRFEGDECKSRLSRKIQGVIPDARRSCIVEEIYFNDDAVTVDDSHQFSLEISLQFSFNEGV